MSLEIVQVYGVASRVGLPITGLRRFGVPPGGAFDRESARLANALVGNPAGTLVWELGMANALFRATSGGMVAVVGAPAPVTIDGRAAPAESTFPVRAGSELHIGPPAEGARVYVAHRSGLTRGPRRLATGLESLSAGPIRVVAGPQADAVNWRSFASDLKVGMASDRVGIRIEGQTPPHDIEAPSEPACVGAIQISGGGGLLVLGPDGPTIGGYPKIAVVIDADVDRLGQLRPGSRVEFLEVSLDEARTLRQEREARLTRQCAELSLVARTA
ncbi:hypothetical protein [Fimbriimonas ginsengisoli]|uniref:Allophanate hydrolase subunit 2 n=1 Tax=Fimbriimonas ginsengisoli Gsoil 348 TaxID=661478 RepID=A0A068NPT2_FIMGI|nr:hypothetical protein [Fimbriimonas ginsengisoli]AIE85451.1 allophanate hydrolase subunit 2 [Fimbriimonas ginsengisoli Gsoil 348]